MQVMERLKEQPEPPSEVILAVKKARNHTSQMRMRSWLTNHPEIDNDYSCVIHRDEGAVEYNPKYYKRWTKH